MSSRRVLIVGPERSRTGGVSRYMVEQQRHLNGVSTRVYETGPAGVGTARDLLAGVLLSLVRMAQFPLQSRPDVVHVHTSFGRSFYRNAFYVLFARYVWRRPVLLHVHGSSFDTFLEPDSQLVGAFQSTVLRAASRVIVLSEYWESVLGEFVPEDRITILPNGVPADQYDPQPPPERPHVVFLSNLIERKGVTEFVDAVDTLLAREEEPGFDVTVAGSGPLADRVEALADEYEAVTYRGYVDEDEKRRLLAASSIYVLPTRAENLPIAILEAMAAGTAVVSTPVGSIPEVIGEENGRLVEPDDAPALTESLSELLAQPETVRRMGEHNRQLAVGRYSWDATARRLEELYATVDGSSRGPPIRGGSESV
jgi:glycosyltransferase involved in cell wall biosynthesis